MQLRIALQLRGRGLVGNLLFQARHNLVLQHLEHSGIDGLVEHKERLAIHGIDPVVGGGFTARLTLMSVTPKAREISACLALPLMQNWAVIMRKVGVSASAWINTGMCPLK